MAITQHIVLTDKRSDPVHPPLTRQGVEEDVRVIIDSQIRTIQPFCLVEMPWSILRIRITINTLVQRKPIIQLSQCLIKRPCPPPLGLY